MGIGAGLGIGVGGGTWGSCVDANGVATLQCIPAIFNNLLNSILVFAGAIAVIIIIISGIRFILSGGDPKKVSTAKRSLTFAILGLIIIVFAFLIINLIAYITGTSCIKIWPPSFTNCQ